MVARLENQLKNKVLTLMNQRNKLSQETECMDSVMLELEREVHTKTKSELITRQPEIIKKCQQITLRHPVTSINSSANLNDFVSEIVPPYDSSTFTIKNFSQLRLKADAIYSPPLNVSLSIVFLGFVNIYTRLNILYIRLLIAFIINITCEHYCINVFFTVLLLC